MSYDATLARRIRDALPPTAEIEERKMFGGLCFLWRGHMICGIVGDSLMARVGAEAHDAALGEPHVRPMDFTGRPMRGMVYVDPPGIADDAALGRWVLLGIEHARSLPPKTTAPRPARVPAGAGRRARAR